MTILPLLAMIFMAVSCSKNNNGSEEQGGGPVKIVLSARVPSVSVSAMSMTKAPIYAGDKFIPGVAGWETSVAADYTQAATWRTTTSEITANAIGASVSLTDDQVYHANDAVKTYMKAWYPDGNMSAGKVTFTTPGDGTIDVLMAPQIAGSKSDHQNKVFSFGHMTTQLIFKVKEGTGLAAGTKILAIKIKNAGLPVGIDLTTDVLMVNTQELTVPGIDGNVTIGTTDEGDIVGEPVMIAPFAGNEVFLEVTTSTATYDNVKATVADDTSLAAGKAYTITLTFDQSAVELQASLSDWVQGVGAGTVE